MKKLNPIEESNFINDEFKEYLKDTFHFNNIEYQTKKICRDVVKTKVEAKMDPMNSYERRAVHNVVGTFKGLESESFGEEPNRYVVIRFKEDA